MNNRHPGDCLGDCYDHSPTDDHPPSKNGPFDKSGLLTQDTLVIVWVMERSARSLAHGWRPAETAWRFDVSVLFSPKDTIGIVWDIGVVFVPIIARLVLIGFHPGDTALEGPIHLKSALRTPRHSGCRTNIQKGNPSPTFFINPNVREFCKCVFTTMDPAAKGASKAVTYSCGGTCDRAYTPFWTILAHSSCFFENWQQE